jgi:hypothetical protein
MKQNNFSPLSFLASLGAGGISVIPFAFLQYSFHTGKGLIHLGVINHAALPLAQQLLFYFLEAVMVVFATIHFILTYQNTVGLIRWIKTDAYREFMGDPLRNAGIMAAFLSYAMTANVFIAPIRFFVPFFAKNLQSFMLPALIAVGILWFFTMRMEIRLLKTSFVKSFDVSKVHFGWLLHPFALGMVTVTLTGIAAMSKAANTAHVAASLAAVSGTMAFFLLNVKLISIFKSHFAAEGLPAKQFLPSMLIIVPNITLLAISGFRMGHYLHHHFNFHTDVLSFLIITISFAFQTWYLWFGLALLKDYFRENFFKNEFYISQWGLVCPFVAYAVLGSFVYKLFLPNFIIYGLIMASTLVAISLFFLLLWRQIKCQSVSARTSGAISCQT